MNNIVKRDENNFFNNESLVKGAAPAEAMINRQAQEVQAAMIIAKKFPRDEQKSYEKILKTCQRKNLAECAVYEYPRGTTKVSGPSIRLAEAMAQNWGNMDFGVVEVERGHGESQIMSYAWDLETNTRQTKVFSVKHWRDTKQGGKELTEERDIYEMVANQGARRLRACILGIIPGDVVDDAVAECEKTMASGEKEPLAERIKTMISQFFTEFKVTEKEIENRFGHKPSYLTETEMVTLKKIFQSLKDGMSSPAEHFGNPDENFISKNEVKNIFTRLSSSSSKRSEEEFRSYLSEKYGLNSTKEIDKKMLPAILNWIEGK